MKMKGLHKYPNGVAFGGKGDVAIFKTSGHPGLVDTGVPEGCLALDFATPALWVKSGPLTTDWVTVNETNFSAEFSRRGEVKTGTWLSYRNVSSDVQGAVSPQIAMKMRVSVFCKKKTTADVRVYVKPNGGTVYNAGYGVVQLSNQKNQTVQFNLQTPLQINDEVGVRVDTGKCKDPNVQVTFS